MHHDDVPDEATTHHLLYGTDATTGIMAVEPSGPDRVTVYQRAGGGELVATEESFQPWLLAARAEPWAGLRPRPEVGTLRGDHELRFLVRFPTWQAFGDASRAATEAKEHFFRIASPVEQYLIATGRTLFKGLVFDDLCRLQLDIETTGLDPQGPESRVVVVALRTSGGVEEILTIETTERDLLERLNERIAALDPDVVEGHNIFNFDLPFLAARAARAGIDLRWGRNGGTVKIGAGPLRFKVGALTLPYTPIRIQGRHIVDTYQQIQRYDTGGRLTSYGLKNAIDALGMTRPDRAFVPGHAIAEVWTHDRERLLRYALDDVRDVDVLSRLALPTEFYQTQLVPRSLQSVATGGPGGKIDDLMVRAYIARDHSVPTARPSREYPGGHAELLEVGSFSPVVKCDVESLYPSIMLVEGITSSRDSLGAYLPMLRDLTRRRLHAKARSRETGGAERAMWEGLQSSFKVLINSFYGYLGFGGGLFNDYEAAERVTLSGQRIIKATVRHLRESNALPIEVDTDGVYFVPPPDVQSEEEERGFVKAIGARLPEGIRLAHDGRYRSMLSLRLKTYGLLGYDGSILLKGSALRSRRMEPCFREFLRDATISLLTDDRQGVRTAYFALAERIRARVLPISAFSQWVLLNDVTLASQPRMKRLGDRLPRSIRSGERVEIYERQDGELTPIDDYAIDENVAYLLRRLHDAASRFRALFPSDSAFDAFFPLLTPKTDLEAARVQKSSTQLGLFD